MNSWETQMIYFVDAASLEPLIFVINNILLYKRNAVIYYGSKDSIFYLEHFQI